MNDPEALKRAERMMRADYVKHNLYVRHVVPPEDLLVWNVKEGWAPLCSFLGQPVPSGPIPHDNKTGDIYIKELAYESLFCLFC